MKFYKAKQTETIPRSRYACHGPASPGEQWHELLTSCTWHRCQLSPHATLQREDLVPTSSAHPSGPPMALQNPRSPLSHVCAGAGGRLSVASTHSLLGQDHPAARAARRPAALIPAFALSPESRLRPSSHYCRSLAAQEKGLPLSLSHVDTEETASLCSWQEDLLV